MPTKPHNKLATEAVTIRKETRRAKERGRMVEAEARAKAREKAKKMELIESKSQQPRLLKMPQPKLRIGLRPSKPQQLSRKLGVVRS